MIWMDYTSVYIYIIEHISDKPLAKWDAHPRSTVHKWFRPLEPLASTAQGGGLPLPSDGKAAKPKVGMKPRGFLCGFCSFIWFLMAYWCIKLYVFISNFIFCSFICVFFNSDSDIILWVVATLEIEWHVQVQICMGIQWGLWHGKCNHVMRW